jgi:hypothetical protein
LLLFTAEFAVSTFRFVGSAFGKNRLVCLAGSKMIASHNQLHVGGLQFPVVAICSVCSKSECFAQARL